VKFLANLTQVAIALSVLVSVTSEATPKQNSCFLEDLGGSAELADECRDSAQLRVDEKSRDAEQIQYFDSVEYVIPESKLNKPITYFDDGYVVLDWFDARSLGKRRGEFSIQLDVFEDNIDGIRRALLKRPTQMDTKAKRANSWFFKEIFPRAFVTDHIAVPVDNLLYVDKSEDQHLVCGTGFWGSALDEIAVPVPYLGGQYAGFDEGAPLNFTAPEHVEMLIQKLLTLDGRPATMTEDGVSYNLVSFKYGDSSRGPIIAAVNPDIAERVFSSKKWTGSPLCEVNDTRVHLNMRVAKKPAKAEVRPELAPEKIEKAAEALKKSKNEGH
jgi:hypothetical protein